MSKFNMTKHGYDTAEVDSYINQIKFEYEQRLGEQKDRIFELVSTVKTLEKQLGEYRAKDNEISSALKNAVKKAREIELEAEERYQREIARLKTFQSKWVSYYNEMAKKYPEQENMQKIEKFLETMDGVLKGSDDLLRSNHRDEEYVKQRQEFLANYAKESARKQTNAVLGRPVRQGRSFDDSVMTMDESIKTTFDMNEVLHPSEKLDLGRLCKELGLIDGE